MHVRGTANQTLANPLAFRIAPSLAVYYAAESSKTTHAAPAAIDACKFSSALILGALDGRSKDELDLFADCRCLPRISAAAAGSAPSPALINPGAPGLTRSYCEANASRNCPASPCQGSVASLEA